MTPEVWFVNLGIKIPALSRVAFSVFGVNIYWYGIILGLGVVAGTFVATREAKRTNQNPEIYLDFLIYAVISSIIFARAYYVIFSWDSYKDDLLSIFAIRNGGIAIYGSIIGAIIAAVVYTKIKRLDLLKFMDTCAFGLIIGQIIGRFGNFVNREAFGGYTECLFAMRYLKSQAGHVSKDILEHLVEFNGETYIQVHPTFLYEALWNLALFIILNVYKKHKKFEGEISALYFIGYGIGRFWIEGLRVDQLKIGTTDLAISQVLSIILIAASVIFIVYKRKRNLIRG